jgi:hypothetical protein
MQYILILQTALGIAKQLQTDHPEMPGADKFGILIDLMISIFGEVDVSKYKPTIELVVTLAVTGWKALNLHGFFKKSAPAAA